MPLPKFDPCDITAPGCCDSLFTVLQDTSTEIWKKLQECLGEDACKDFNTYVSVNEPSDPVGDYLAVWASVVSPILQTGSTLALQPTKFPMPQATINVKLMETGYPTIGSDGSVPSPEEIEFASHYSYAHFEVVLRAIYGGLRTKALPGSGCSFIQMNEARPTARSGGMAGWITSYTIGLGW